MAEKRHYIEWDADKQSAADLESALFDRMVADGLPIEVAAHASEDMKDRALEFVEHEKLRIENGWLWRRLRMLQPLVSALFGIVMGQALTIQILCGWEWWVILAELPFEAIAVYALYRNLRR